MATFDLLQPIGKNNRNEHILVEYEGFIHSTAENLIIALEDHLDDVISSYPKLKNYIFLPPDELYNSVMYYEAEQLLDILTNEDYTPESIEKTCLSLITEKDRVSALHNTFFNESLINLSEMDYVKSITIIKGIDYTETDINNIKAEYNQNINKINIITGNIVTYYKNHPEITTVLLGNPEDLKYLIEYENKEHLSKTLFILRNNVDTLTFPKSSNILPSYTNEDYYQSIINKHITSIVHANVDCIRRDLRENELDPDAVG